MIGTQTYAEAIGNRNDQQLLTVEGNKREGTTIRRVKWQDLPKQKSVMSVNKEGPPVVRILQRPKDRQPDRDIVKLSNSTNKQTNKQKQPQPTMQQQQQQNKQRAVEHNKNKDNWPMCEHCNKQCFASNHATKMVCEKAPLYLCNNCYHKLPVLDEDENRRKCPNHDKCVAFESKADRKKFKDSDLEDFRLDYFADPTKCLYHPDLTLIGSYEKWCLICDENDDEVKLYKDNQKQGFYKWCGYLAGKWMQDNRPDLAKERNVAGELADAFHIDDTPLQQEAKKNHREWEIERKKGKEEFDRILSKWVKPTYRWLKEKLMEKEQSIIIELAVDIRDGKIEEGKDQAMICFGCLNMDIKEKFEVREFEGPICKRCRSSDYEKYPLFMNAQYAPPVKVRQTTTITITQIPQDNKRKRKSQGQRQREKQRKQGDTIIEVS